MSTVEASQAAEPGRSTSPTLWEPITEYLVRECPEFVKLRELRKIGWENPEGDKWFQKQRNNADKSSEQTARFFYALMKKIGEELHQEADAFALRPLTSRLTTVLDMCMAPGGFLETAMRKNPGSHALAFSLPVAKGGHQVLLPELLSVEKRYLDVNLLAEDMGRDLREIAPDHPDAGNFLPRQLRFGQNFDLVVCDGQVLRTHGRAEYRERREARRLTIAQLALGLQHLHPGGTMIVLLHKAEALDSVRLFSLFDRFADVRLVKPRSGHANRSSFYMIARHVQSQDDAAVDAVVRWKAEWRAVTFGEGGEGGVAAFEENEESVRRLVEDFGPRLVELARDVWRIQAESLDRAPFTQTTKRWRNSRLSSG